MSSLYLLSPQSERTNIFDEIWRSYFEPPTIQLSSKVALSIANHKKQGPPYPANVFDEAREEVYDRIKTQPFPQFLQSLIDGAFYGLVSLKFRC